MDGSHHPWLGDQVPPFTLLIAVDDATGTVANALFCEKEEAYTYFLLIQDLVQSVGIPIALYVDRHGVFRHTPGFGLPGTATQFSRAMDELGIQMIFALSPQAKGRVERAAGTFQDRLVTELRLAGASSIGEANGVLGQFLPRYNRRFRVPPQCSRDSLNVVGRWDCGIVGMNLDRCSLWIQAPQESGPSRRLLTWKYQGKHTLQLTAGAGNCSWSGWTALIPWQSLGGTASAGFYPKRHEGDAIPTRCPPC